MNVSGRLPQHRARVIKLQRKRGHRSVVVATSRTRRSGRYGFSTHAPAQRLVVYRVAAPRTSGLQAVTSRTLTVRPLAQHVGLTAPPSAAPSSTATLVVDAAPPRRGRRVSVQRLVDDVSVDQSTVVQAGGRRVSVAVSVPGSGLRREPEPSVSYRAVLHRFRGAPSLVGAAARVAIDRPADTTAPPVPSGLVVQPGNGQVGLAWDAVAGPGSEDLAGYMVFQSVSGGAWSPVMGTAESPLSASSALVRGLDNGVSYAFAVASVDAALNVSERSAAVEATPEDPDAGPALVGFLADVGGRGRRRARRDRRDRARRRGRGPVRRSGGHVRRDLPASVGGPDSGPRRGGSGGAAPGRGRDSPEGRDPFTFVRRELESVDVAVARPDTVMLTLDDVYAVASVATGAIDITLADGGAVGGVVRGAGVYLEPGHPDASTGLAGTVQSLDEVDGRTVVTVERAPVDQVLAERDFARSVSFGTSRGAVAPLPRGGERPGHLFGQPSFLDCRRVVQHETAATRRSSRCRPTRSTSR